MPEETVEVTGARQQIKLRIIEGGVLFMSFVVLCLIFGLALAIERIIYLNMATTNTKSLMDNVEEALKEVALTLPLPCAPIPAALCAAIFKQGLERARQLRRAGQSRRGLRKPREHKLERGELDQPLHRPCSDARIHGNGNRHDRGL